MRKNGLRYYSLFPTRHVNRLIASPVRLLPLVGVLFVFCCTFRNGVDRHCLHRREEGDETQITSGIGISPRILLLVENYSLWGFSGGVDGLLQKVVSRDHWGPAMTQSSEGTIEELSITNAKTQRLQQLNLTMDELRARYARHRAVRKLTGCDTLSVPFNPLYDTQCIRYFTNASNWLELVPIRQTFDQRTIKFRAIFRPLTVNGTYSIEHPLEVVVKVPQNLFRLEAANEVFAFNVDRLLFIHRVPPTGLSCVPLRMIRDSVRKYKNVVETNEEFLNSSGVVNYEEWIEKDFFLFLNRNKRFVRGDKQGEKCALVSMQLKIADVVHLSDTVMKIFHVRFNNSWFQYFNLKATTRGLRGGVLPAHHTPPHPTLLHLAALCVFDFVLGNGDRSPVKNNFVVGGGLLRSTGDKDFLLHPNHPTFVYLDQGSSLRKSYLERNPIAQSHLAFSRGEEDTFCLFHGPLLRRIHQLAAQVPAPKMRKKLGNRSSGGGATESLFVNMLRRRLPPEVLLVIGGVKLAECGARLKELLGVADRCLSDERIQGIVLFP